MKRKMNPLTIIILIAALVIFALIIFGKIDAIYLLPLLGAVCAIFGIAVLVQGMRSEKGLKVSDKQKAVISIIMGAFLIVLGLIEILGIQFSEMGWNGMMGIILVLIITYFIIRLTHR